MTLLRPLLVTSAVLLTMDPERPDPLHGWMLVGADGRITALGSGEPDAATEQGAEILDVGGALVAPGFVSAHSHLFTSGCRGLGTDQALYGWIEAMLAPIVHADTDDIYWLSRHGAQDFLVNGITTAYDFTHSGLGFSRQSSGLAHHEQDVPDPAFQHAQLRARVDAGLRSVHSVMLAQVTDAPSVRAHLDDVVGLAAPFAADPIHLGVAISGTVQWADTPATATFEVDAMRRHGLVNQPHFLETPYDAEFHRTKFDWYRDAGALGPDLVFGHFIQTSDEILVEAAAAGCAMSWQPMSNGRLASGVADIPRMRELGMRVGMGLDDQSCTDVSDPFANMRFGLYLLRAQHRDPAVMGVRDILEMHTRGSAEALGLDDQVGSLRVGRWADFLVVDPRNPDTGPVWDPWGTYVLACGLRNLQQVRVGGRLVAEHGRATDPQATTVVDQVHERLARLARARGVRRQ